MRNFRDCFVIQKYNDRTELFFRSKIRNISNSNLILRIVSNLSKILDIIIASIEKFFPLLRCKKTLTLKKFFPSLRSKIRKILNLILFFCISSNISKISKIIIILVQKIFSIKDSINDASFHSIPLSISSLSFHREKKQFIRSQKLIHYPTYSAFLSILTNFSWDSNYLCLFRSRTFLPFHREDVNKIPAVFSPNQGTIYSVLVLLA